MLLPPFPITSYSDVFNTYRRLRSASRSMHLGHSKLVVDCCGDWYPVRNVCDHPQTKFAFSTIGWVTFTVNLKIGHKDGHVDDVEHPLVFEREHVGSVSERNRRKLVAADRAGVVGMGHSHQGAVRGTRPHSLRIPNHVRLTCTRQNGFELTIRGWETFKVLIMLTFKDGSTQQRSHQLQQS
jgi:hypothetical protein